MEQSVLKNRLIFSDELHVLAAGSEYQFPGGTTRSPGRLRRLMCLYLGQCFVLVQTPKLRKTHTKMIPIPSKNYAQTIAL